MTISAPLASSASVRRLTLPDVWLVDVDGTIALRRFGGRGPYDWNRVGEDLPNDPVIAIVRALLATGRNVLFPSGRNEVCYQATWHWIDRHVAPWERSPGMRGLLMRPDTPRWRMAPDVELKRYFYEELIHPAYRVVGVLDDRNGVVAMWRELGLTCLQVAEGDF